MIQDVEVHGYPGSGGMVTGGPESSRRENRLWAKNAPSWAPARKGTGGQALGPIPGILGQDIEVSQMAACAVEEEAEDLFEKFDDG